MEQKAVAHTIMNRVNEPRGVWSNAKTVTDVFVKSQYNAVGSTEYNKAMDYLNNRNGSDQVYEDLIANVMPIYCGKEEDFTGGAHYIFNVSGSSYLLSLLQSNPDRYTEIRVDGVDPDNYRMYRCEW